MTAPAPVPHSATRMDQPIDTLSFEAALKELEQIVGRLESGDTPLDEAITLYERGSALRAHCAARLDAAQARIESIRLGPDGTPGGTAPFDAG